MASSLPRFAAWKSTSTDVEIEMTLEYTEVLERVREPASILRSDSGALRATPGFVPSVATNGVAGHQTVAVVPAVYPEWLGDRSFASTHGVRFPYVVGAMANGIASVELVVASARAGILAFYGAAGLGLDRIERDLLRIETELGRGPNAPTWGANLIHAPNEPALEMGTTELFLREGVRRVSASAYMKLTRPIVRYAYSGVHQLADGTIVRPNAVFAKISRPEVARQFMSPAPKAMLDDLFSRGMLSADEVRLAQQLPVAEDITVEADSGGHTDNQPLGALFGVITHLRDDLTTEFGYARPIRVGAAGGIGTPVGAAAAFALGAAYVLTGSVNQAAVESGLSEEGRLMLAKTAFGDVMMAPAADMFEQGVKLQVLKRGTMFGVRADKLWDVYRTYPSLEDIPSDEREALEKKTLSRSIDDIWAECEAFWARRDPDQLTKAAEKPKHKMALVFRWYLGMSSRWAIAGESSRAMDYQIWCGPAMAAFNDWVRGSFLEEPANRGVVPIALNILEGAARITRAHQLRAFGLAVPSAAFQFAPRRIGA